MAVTEALPPPWGTGALAAVLGLLFCDLEEWQIPAKPVLSQVLLHVRGLSHSNFSCYYIVFALILLAWPRMNLLFSDRLRDSCWKGEMKFGQGPVGAARDW